MLTVAVLVPAGAAIADSVPAPQVRPSYVPDQLQVRYVVDLMPRGFDPGAEIPPGSEALFSAAKVTVLSDLALSPPEVVEHLATVQLQAGARLGETFRTLQTFPRIPYAGWYVVGVGARPRPVGDHPLMQTRRVFNLSMRAEVHAGDGVTIGGIVIPGEFARLVVFKVRGPSLTAFGVDGVLADPQLHLHEGSRTIMQNDDWESLSNWEVDLARTVCPSPDDPKEAMIVTYLDPGPYSAVVTDAHGGTGVVLLEVYIQDDFIVE